MTEIIGLDPSLSSTGIATPDGKVRHLAAPARKMATKEDPSMRWDLARFHGLADRILDAIQHEDWPPEDVLLLIEKPSLNSTHQAVPMAGVAWIIRDRLALAGYTYVDVPPAVLKKYATGKGNAGKPEVVAEAIRRLDYQGHDDNEADALWLRQIGMNRTHDKRAEPVPKVHEEAFKKWALPDWALTA